MLERVIPERAARRALVVVLVVCASACTWLFQDPPGDGGPDAAIECSADDPCDDPARPHCRSDGRCVECLESEHCELGHSCVGSACEAGCDGPTRCPEGQVCFEGVCRVPAPEVCNGIDDDLDGAVDEDFDNDEDGFSSCGRVSDPPDCDDTSADAHPGLPEACDRLDNDCDGEVDEDPGICPDGEVCERTSGECVPRDCVIDSDCDDPSREFCHDDGVCYPRWVGFAEPCVRDDQCGSTLACLETNPLGHPGRYCTRVCCDPSDCPEADTWCADNGIGLKVCAPSEWSGGARVSCGFHSCAVCVEEIPGLTFSCADQCCHDADCGSFGCQLVQARTVATGGDDRPLLVCDHRDTGSGLFDVIDCGWLSSESCLSGLSWPLGGSRCQCTAPCCSHDDCSTGDHPDGRCVLDSSGYVGCYDPGALGPLGAGITGEPCRLGEGIEDCASGVCHPGGYCTEVCCSGTRCPAVGATCRPVVTGGRVATLCTLP